MKVKRLFVVLIMILLIGSEARGESGFTDIRGIISSTPCVWRETYETKWRQIDVDVPVIVPETDAVPILRVRRMPAPAEGSLAEWQDITFNRPRTLQANLRKNDFLKSNERPRGMRVIYGSKMLELRPENMTMIHAEAVTKALRLGEELFGLPATSFRLKSTGILDCVYTYRRNKGEIVFGKQVSETGTYNLSFDQLFHGISMRDGLSCYADFGNGMPAILHTPVFGVVLDDTGCTKVRASLFEVVDTVAEDVPLLSFDVAKERFVDEISAGRLRTVDEICFCYVPYTDAKDKDLVWLCPAWVLNGSYTTDAEKEYSPVMDELTGEVMGNGMEHHTLIVDAQSGKLPDYNAKGKDRRTVVPIITWEDIGR